MIVLKDVVKKYIINKQETITALKGISVEFREGELVVLKGVSGSGKSTILSLIAALSKPSSGEVIVDNRHISKLPDHFAALYRRESIGFIFQKYNLIPNLSVKENIALPLIPSNPSLDDLEEKVLLAMQKFHIDHKENMIVQNLSGGEQQRVAIARSWINNPSIIIADEPTANLDRKLTLNFIDILKELKDKNKTIILATHDPIFFDLDFVDKIVNVEDGLIV